MSAQVHCYPKGPDVLVRLYQALTETQEGLVQTRKSIILRRFQDVLRTETRLFEATPTKSIELAEGLVYYWLYLLSQRLGKTKSMELYTDDIDTIFRLILKYDLLASVLHEYGQGLELAFIAGVRIFQTSYGKRHPKENNVGDLLTTWFKQTPPSSTTTDLATFVDYMYGPGAWELYGTEIDWEGRVPRHLYTQGLTLIGTGAGTLKAKRKGVLNLPDDF